jgi:predicted NAD/FAD-binding protein
MKLAVIGGGWAGMAAAVTAADAGHQVTVYEAARTLGGRARELPLTLPDGRDILVDNGQHILIGAYTDSLRLMRKVGVDPDQALLRLPLALVFPDGTGLALSWGRAPWDALAGILRAQRLDLARPAFTAARRHRLAAQRLHLRAAGHRGRAVRTAHAPAAGQVH